MLPDDPTAGHSSGDVSVGEIACLDQNVAYYEEVQGGFQEGIHDGVGERTSGKLQTKGSLPGV